MVVCCASPSVRPARSRKETYRAGPLAASWEASASLGINCELADEDDNEYFSADEQFEEEVEEDSLCSQGLIICSAAGKGSPTIPWRFRRAYNWDGRWREDKALGQGLMEGFERLGYPWWALKIMRATPGCTWNISQSSNSGHTLLFDTNSRVMNKLLTIVPLHIKYGDDEESAPRYEQTALADDLAPHIQHAWWSAANVLWCKDEWIESAQTRIKSMRNKKCTELTKLTYRENKPAGSIAGSLLLEKWTWVQGLTPEEGLFATQVLIREDSPPAKLLM